MGVKQDYVEALYWYRKAAAQGLPEAESNVGVMYEDGLGVERDYQQAVDWYSASAMQGASRAQYNLATMYSAGRGVPLDYVRAYLWFSRSAAAGDPLAARSLKNLSMVMTPHQKELALSLLADGQDAKLSEAQAQSPFDADHE
jgi:TPR repeat protein